jgi:hypothetical protein
MRSKFPAVNKSSFSPSSGYPTAANDGYENEKRCAVVSLTAAAKLQQRLLMLLLFCRGENRIDDCDGCFFFFLWIGSVSGDSRQQKGGVRC